jgi:hypothetical protein
MSSEVSSATTPSGGPASDGPAARRRGSRWRRWRWPASVAGVIVLTALVSTALLPDTSRGALDPRSADPEGSRAIAQILRRQGVEITVVERSTEAVDGATSGMTLVVVRPSLLGPAQLERLAGSDTDLVLVEPDLVTLRELAPALTPLGTATPHREEPACADPDAVAAGRVTGGGHLYALSPTPSGTTSSATTSFTGCYPDTSRTGGPARFSLARLDTGDRRITVLGQRQVLQNGSLVVEGNAALALRVLGTHGTLRWYLPDPVELKESTDITPADLLPPWVPWAFAQLVLAVLAALIWRGRRFGRVVTEPLPVVVRSAEAVEGRARLYRTGRAAGRAAAVLRTASLRRLGARLGVPPDAGPQDVVSLTAQATGASPGHVHETLLGDPPKDDTALVALAAALDELERAVAGPSQGRHRYGGPSEVPAKDAPGPEGGR